jgi:hypothetical protein
MFSVYVTPSAFSVFVAVNDWAICPAECEGDWLSEIQTPGPQTLVPTGKNPSSPLS